MKQLKVIFSAVVLAGVVGFPLTSFAGGVHVINVEAKEWGITPDKSSVHAGPVKFVVKNAGQDTHEVEIIRLDGKKFDGFPLASNGGADEKWLVPHSLGEVEDIKPGKTKSFTVNLKPGKYALVCNIVEKEKDGTLEAHYSMGMRTAFVVK